MSIAHKIRGALAGAVLSLAVLPMTSVASSACTITSFATQGCFGSFSANNFSATAGSSIDLTSRPTPAGTPTFVSLNLFDPLSLVNYVTFTFASILGSNPFTISVQGFDAASNPVAFAPILPANLASPGPSTVTFFSAIGIAPGIGQLSLIATGNANLFVQISDVTVAAPAPIPGAGFLSFLGMAFAGLFRRSRHSIARLRINLFKRPKLA